MPTIYAVVTKREVNLCTCS